MARYVIIFLALIALLIALMVSLMPKQQRADLTFVNRGSISTLDPAAMSWMQDIRMALTIWEGLYTYDPVTTEPIPGAASGVDISADKRTNTFHIRPDARWSNGDSLTADDFVYAWRRPLEPGTTADYAFFFDLIHGGKEYVSWRLEAAERLGGIGDVAKREAALNAHLADADVRFNETVGISALDEKTLRVRLARPVAYFLDLCAFSIFLPVHRESVDPFKIVGETGLIYYDEQWVKPGHTQWNGPFVLEDWAFKRHLRLRKNPYYWDQDNVRLDSIEAVEVEDPNTAWLLYSGGRVDWLSSIDTVYTPKLIAQSNSPVAGAVNHKGAKRNDIHSFPAFGTYFYNFNCTDKLPDGSSNPFQDVRVRQAFTMAVNKQELVDEVVRRSNPTATTFIPPRTIAKYPDVSGLPYDVERAQSLMAAAGFPDGKGFPEVVVLFNTGFQHGEIAQAIIGMWSATLGIKRTRRTSTTSFAGRAGTATTAIRQRFSKCFKRATATMTRGIPTRRSTRCCSTRKNSTTGRRGWR